MKAVQTGVLQSALAGLTYLNFLLLIVNLPAHWTPMH